MAEPDHDRQPDHADRQRPINRQPPDDQQRKADPASTDDSRPLNSRATQPTEIIGLRHGEKLHETLCTLAELSGAHEHDAYYRIPLNTRDLAYSAYLTEGGLPKRALAAEDYTSDNAKRFSIAEVKQVHQQTLELRKIY